MTAHVGLKEGDVLTVPCRHCSSVSLEVVVRPALTRTSCVRCHGECDVAVERRCPGWMISVTAVTKREPVPED